VPESAADGPDPRPWWPDLPLEAGSTPVVAGFGEQRADLASRRNGGADPASGGSCGLWMARWACSLDFFCFLI